MKKIILLVLVTSFSSHVYASRESAFEFITDPTVMTTAAIGFTANALPHHIVTNESGLIFALCVNYLMAEGFSFDRAAKFAASYIAGAVIGRIVKTSTKSGDRKSHASPKISADADAWAAQ